MTASSALWYGKGPGVDRSGDVFRHANMAGTSPHGGVLALMGDDHTAESSTVAHQSEFHFVDVMIPILNPAGVQEILDYGLYGYAMSRFCGTWVALQVRQGQRSNSTAIVDGSLDRVKIVIPDDFAMPPGGLNIRTGDGILDQEARLQDYKRDAMLAFVRANNLNRIVLSGGRNAEDRHHHGRQVLSRRAPGARRARHRRGARPTTWACGSTRSPAPGRSSQRELVEFARGLDIIIVVEEKRSLIEVQVREELYGTPNQPICIGKKDESGNWLFPVKGALDPNDIAIAIGERLLQYHNNDDLRGRVARLKQAQAMLAATERRRDAHAVFLLRLPAQHLDQGAGGHARLCGHRLPLHGAVDGPLHRRLHPDGRRGRELDRRGAVLDARRTSSRTSATAPTTIPACWRCAGRSHTKTNITYKILFNDAVAMTGGQRHEGGLTVDMIARQVRAEGVERIALVTDEPDKYPPAIALAGGHDVPPSRRSRRRAARARRASPA